MNLTDRDKELLERYLLPLQTELRFFVNTTLDAARAEVLGEPPASEIVIPLIVHPSYFKGRKPIETQFPNGEVIQTPKWKLVVAAIMQDALKDKQVQGNLYALRGRIMGRNRTILASSAEDMKQPIKLAEDLFLETNYDTETLLYVLMRRVLRPCGYEPTGIRIKIKV